VQRALPVAIEAREQRVALGFVHLRLERGLDQDERAHALRRAQRLGHRDQPADRVPDQHDRVGGLLVDRLVERERRLLEHERGGDRRLAMSREFHEDDAVVAREVPRDGEPLVGVRAQPVHEHDDRPVPHASHDRGAGRRRGGRADDDEDRGEECECEEQTPMHERSP
jgi:hypothetical protein